MAAGLATRAKSGQYRAVGRVSASCRRSVLFAYAATLAPSAPPKGRVMRCTVLGFTSNLAAVLRTLMPPARAALMRSANLSAIGGRPSRLPSRLARYKPARTRSWIIERSNSASPTFVHSSELCGSKTCVRMKVMKTEHEHTATNGGSASFD